MRIVRLELTNFRTFGQAVIQDVPDTVVLVSPNGRGKSSVLEAIAGIHDLVTPYHQDHYPFTMQWQKRNVPVWPQHLPEPVKIGERRAEIRIEVQATGVEIDYLRTANVSEDIGKAHFAIEDGRHITKQESNETIRRLFQYHNPKDGVGFVDYIRPVRFYRSRQLGDFASELTDQRLRQSISEFYRPYHEHEKFSGFKSFVVSTQLNDFSHLQATGEHRDSLALFREVFNHFFAPKRLIGYRMPESGGQPEVAVESVFGRHDTDALSDGEKEVLHILAHLYRFRHLHNIVLWDTPELHLNAALEARLFDAIRRVSPSDQFWIATHSLEFINSVPLESIFIIQQDGNSATVERAVGEDRPARISMYREMGAQIGLQLVSAVVVFVEGKEANSDKLILDRLVAPQFPGVNFIAGGSCENILSVGTRANQLLGEACTNGDFFAILDRDYRIDEEVEKIVQQYSGRLFMWNVHEIENIFLNPSVVYETLSFLGLTTAGDSENSVYQQIHGSAQSLREWIAADWAAWECEKQLQTPARRIGGKDPRGSLEKYAESLKAKATSLGDVSQLESRFQEKLEQVDRLLATRNWLLRLPGKQILRKFVEDIPSLDSEAYLRTAVGVILDRKLEVPELERLKQTLANVPKTMK